MSREQWRRVCIVLCISAVLAAAGCGREGRVPKALVVGSVTYGGKPVEKGSVRFIPREGTAGPITIASLSDGKYSTAASGGVPVGSHRVEIDGYDAETFRTAPRGPGSPPVEQLLPDQYNRESALTADVVKGKSQTIDFALDR